MGRLALAPSLPYRGQVSDRLIPPASVPEFEYADRATPLDGR